MVKVLQINSSANVGSTGRIAEQIGELILKEGWESYIAYGRYVNPSKSQLIKVGADKISQTIHLALSRLFDAHGQGSFFDTRNFLQKLDVINPDIVHLHNIHGYFLNYPLLFEYLIKRKIPVVWTLHDCWPFTGHCSYFDYVNCEKWRTECHDCPAKRNYPQSLWLDRSRQNYELKKQLFSALDNITFVPVSEWLGGLTKQSFLGKYPIRVIHNGIDISVFKPYETSDDLKDKYGLRGKTVIVGCAFVWEERKGFKDILELSKMVSDDVVFVLVGLDKERTNKLPSNVFGIERTSSATELAKIYSCADVLINPTYEDNFPTVNLESLACGTPVITYRTGGSPEAVDERTGIVVEKGNISGLNEAINNIRKCNRLEMEKLCRKRAEELFDNRNAYTEYIEVYKEILNEKNR